MGSRFLLFAGVSVVTVALLTIPSVKKELSEALATFLRGEDDRERRRKIRALRRRFATLNNELARKQEELEAAMAEAQRLLTDMARANRSPAPSPSSGQRPPGTPLSNSWVVLPATQEQRDAAAASLRRLQLLRAEIEKLEDSVDAIQVFDGAAVVGRRPGDGDGKGSSGGEGGGGGGASAPATPGGGARQGDFLAELSSWGLAALESLCPVPASAEAAALRVQRRLLIAKVEGSMLGPIDESIAMLRDRAGLGD